MIPQPRAVLAAAIVVASAVALTACSSTTGSDGGASSKAATKTLLYSPITLAIPALKEEAQLIEKEAKAAGWKVTTVDPNNDATTQAQQIQQSINSGQADAVWVIPVDTKALSGVISLAQSKDIPLALTGAPADFGLSGAQKGIVFGSTSPTEYGATIAKQTADCVDSRLNGKSKALYITQVSTVSGADEQTAAIKSTIASDSPGTTIEATGISSSVSTAQTKVSQLLQSHPDANTVITTSDEGALGAIGAFKAAGKKLTCLVGGGGGGDAQKALKAGEMYAIVAFDYASDVKNVFGHIKELSANPKEKGEVGTVPITVLK